MKTLYFGKWMYTADEKGTVLKDFGMLAEDGRIVWIKPRQEAEEETADKVVTLGESYVAPGFIDSHVHLVPNGGWNEETPNEERKNAALVCEGVSNARELLKAGVVACRDLGSYKGYALGIRDAVKKGLLEGPEIVEIGRAHV